MTAPAPSQASDGVQQWRLLRDGDLAGARNMARDVAMLERLPAPTLRLYGWSPPCLTLGRHQGVEAADLEFCRRHGVDVVRRPTGGRAVLHHLELTYAVVARLGQAPIPHRLQETYALLCRPLVAALRTLGIAAQLTGGEVNLALPGPRSNAPCFQAPAAGEVVVGGRKLIGSAMRSHRGAILQHGAMLLDWHSELQAGCMGLGDDRLVWRSVTTFQEQLTAVPARQQIERAIIHAYEEHLGIRLTPGQLTPQERQREAELEPTFRVDPETAEGPGSHRPRRPAPNRPT